MHIHAAAPSGTLITIDGQWELQSLVGKGSFAKGARQYLLGSKLLCLRTLVFVRAVLGPRAHQEARMT